ncbi:MAG TPA: hypothetical protein VJJ77_00655 [Dongiaceae bacterium]|nr:hypothetical protein [Dongiaceae bacterium]
MSSALEQLIRLHGWTLEERRRKVRDLDNLAARLRTDVTRLAEELARETEAGTASLEMRRAYDAYAAQVRARRTKLIQSIADIEAEIVKAQADVAEAFQELKKHEQTLSQRRARAQAQRDRGERMANDELGLAIFRRRG